MKYFILMCNNIHAIPRSTASAADAGMHLRSCLASTDRCDSHRPWFFIYRMNSPLMLVNVKPLMNRKVWGGLEVNSSDFLRAPSTMVFTVRWNSSQTTQNYWGKTTCGFRGINRVKYHGNRTAYPWQPLRLVCNVVIAWTDGKFSLGKVGSLSLSVILSV